MLSSSYASTLQKPRSVVLAVLVLLVASSSPGQAQTTTQRVELAEGKNFVSLAVQPTDARMETLFAPVLDDILAVWSEDERRFAPGHADELAEWDWRKSYVVYAQRAVALDVTGEAIGDDAEIALQTGLNSVPYTNTYPMHVEDAFAPLADVLVYVEDAAGRRYPTESGREALRQLEPGQGYKLYLDAPATLRYELVPSDFQGDVNVNTMAEALALAGLEPGQTVGVAGYYRPGDGGGGVFEVRDSGAATDGGLVFVPDEHVSEEVGEGYAFGSTGVYGFRELPEGESVVFGTLRLTLNNPSETDPREVDGLHLHGHRWASRRSRRPMFGYGLGRFVDNLTLKDYFHNRYGDRREGRIWFRYRHTTSPVRLHRLDVRSTLNAHWFGIRPASEGPMWTGGTDVQPLLNHMVNVADDRNAEAPGSVTSLLFPALDTYDYFGAVELADGLTLRGAGGTFLDAATDDLGHTYRPVRVREEHTRLRVMDGEAFQSIRMRKDPGAPDYREPDVKEILQTRATAISPEPAAMSFGVEDLVLDGNWENNTQAWDEGWASHRELETWGRNSPGWAAINGSNHGGKRIPQGQQVTVRNVAVLGYGSNGLLGNANNEWTVTNLLAGNSLWNHVVYNANGTYTNLTLTGFAWGHVAWGIGTIENLVYERAAPSPTRQASELFAVRGGDAYDPNDLAGEDGYFTREDGTISDPHATDIRGFYLDLRGSALHASFRGLGPNVRIGGTEEEPGVIVYGDRSVRGVYYENGNGYQKALYPNNVFEHIRLVDTGGERAEVFSSSAFTESTVRNVRTETASDAPRQSATSLKLRAGWKNAPSWDAPQRIRIEGVVEGTPHFFIAKVSVDEQAAGLRVDVVDSSFRNTSNTLFRGKDGTGIAERFEGDPTKIRVYFEDSEFNIHDGNFQNTEVFFAMSRFLRCTDRISGRTSEDAGSFEYTAEGGETRVDIPTSLFWKPLDPSYIEVQADVGELVASSSAAPLTSNSVDWRAPLIRVELTRALRSGERVTFDWSGAVRPFEVDG